MRIRRSQLSRLSLLLVVCAWVDRPALGGWKTQVYGPHRQAATLNSDDVPESSGVVASQWLNPDIYWTHNDSGCGPQVWAFRLNAADQRAKLARSMGYVELAGTRNVDWEDIACGPGNRIYIFDGGDNPPCNRADKQIHRFFEPKIDLDGPPIARKTVFESIRFDYPDPAHPTQAAVRDDQRFDAECLFVHPVSGDMYIVTKRGNGGVPTARVYKLQAAKVTWKSPAVHVLEFVKDLSPVIENMTTAGDIDADGARIVIRNYANAFEFTLPEGAAFDSIFDQRPAVIPLFVEVQGEGICYSRDGRDLIATSELVHFKRKRLGPSTMPVFIVPWQLANLQVQPRGPTGVVIRWDTAQAAHSTVQYGATTDYGQTASGPESTTHHEVRLDGLKATSKYFYKVISGDISYPPADGVEKVFFILP